MTGGTAPGFISLANILTRSGYRVLGTDYQKSSISRVHSYEYEITPSVTVNSNKKAMEKYVSSLEEIAMIYDVAAILPIRTGDVQAIVQSYDGDIIPIVPTRVPEILSILNNKWLLMNTAKALGVLVPYTREIYSVEELDDVIEDIFNKTNWADAVVKPKIQTGSRGMRFISKGITEKDIWNQFMLKKPSECLQLSIDQFKNIVGNNDLGKLMFMEYLPGSEITVDCLCYKGKTLAVVPRTRIKTTGGITSKGMVSKGPEYLPIYNACEKLIKELNLSYNVGFQFKCDWNGVPKLMECNPRLQGTTCLTVKAGVNVVDLAIKLALGELDPDLLIIDEYDIEWNIRMERAWQEWYE